MKTTHRIYPVDNERWDDNKEQVVKKRYYELKITKQKNKDTIIQLLTFSFFMANVFSLMINFLIVSVHEFASTNHTIASYSIFVLIFWAFLYMYLDNQNKDNVRRFSFKTRKGAENYKNWLKKIERWDEKK